jgi:hypothetical protein
MGVAAIIFFDPIVVFLKDAITHIIGLIGVTLAAAGLLYVIFDKNARMILSTLYLMVVQKIMGWVVELNPIVILEDGIKKIYTKIANIDLNMNKMNTVRLKAAQKIKEKKKMIENELAEAQAAQDNGMAEMVLVHQRQAKRLVDLTQDYLEMQQTADSWYKTFTILSKKANATALDAENEVSMLKEKYEMVKDTHSAFKSIMSILKGDPDELTMYNKAFDFVNNDIMDKVGEMDRVLNSTGSLLDQVNLENDVMSIKGKDMQKKFNELGIDALFTKLDALPSHGLNELMKVDNIASETPVLEKSSKKYFN